MAGRLLTPGWARALDSDGFPIPARISFFLTETDALASVYADEDLTTPLPNPVPSNSAGRFPAIWAADGDSYDWSVEAPYGPPGTPFTGTGLTTALASDVLAADAAEAAADAAESSATAAVSAETGAEAALAEIVEIIQSAPEAPSVVNKANVAGDNVASLGQAATFRTNIGAVGSVSLASGAGGDLVGNALPAGANLRTQTYAEFIDGGTIQPTMFAGNEEQQFLRAIVEAGTVRNDGLGQTVSLPRGERDLTAVFNIDNRVTIQGVNKRGTILKAAPGFAGGPDNCMATVFNGINNSTFDNPLKHLTLNCNDIAGISGVVSDAWQEGGGLNNVLIQKFRDHGVRIRSGYGGASTLVIENSEIFGSGVGGGATGGIICEQIALEGGFLLSVGGGTTITGESGVPMDYGIKMENDSLHANILHFEECADGIVLDGAGDSVLIGVTGATTVTTVVRVLSTFTGNLTMLGCTREGSTNLLADERTGGLGTITWDTDIKIRQNPTVGFGEVAAVGNFNGNLGSPNLDKSFGVSAITKGTAGVYTLTLSRPGVNSNSFAVFASSLTPGATVQTELLTASTVRITNRDSAGNGADTIEVKFLVMRCA